jgi:hypothetical protein
MIEYNVVTMKMEVFRTILKDFKYKYAISTDNLEMDKEDLECWKRTDIDENYLTSIDFYSTETPNIS